MHMFRDVRKYVRLPVGTLSGVPKCLFFQATFLQSVYFA